TRAAYDQIQNVEDYATLETCRREYLLRHFGDTQEVVPCGGCDVCLGEADNAATFLERAPAMAQMSIPTANYASVEGSNRVAGAPSPALDAELFKRLRAWRGDQARRQQVPAYVVLHNSQLEEIARRKPRNVHELGSIKGIGLRRAARYGDEIMALVRDEEPTTGGDGASDYRRHLEAAERLLRSGQGAAAVPELTRALEIGGEEAKRDVDALLAR
ncbi:MAG: HRDC domain-containing protein, partial [Rubrobacter sp.]|nr:HRDC domain-containing protein [Rubrobacter sp.]